MGLINGETPISDESNNIIKNVTCDSTVFVKAAVYLDVSGVAFNANADSTTTANIIGFVISKQSATTCTIRVSGTSETIFTALDPTKDYFLSNITDGEISTVAPTTTGHVFLKVGQPFSATSMFIKKGELIVRK